MGIAYAWKNGGKLSITTIQSTGTGWAAPVQTNLGVPYSGITHQQPITKISGFILYLAQLSTSNVSGRGTTDFLYYNNTSSANSIALTVSKNTVLLDRILIHSILMGLTQ